MSDVKACDDTTLQPLQAPSPRSEDGLSKDTETQQMLADLLSSSKSPRTPQKTKKKKSKKVDKQAIEIGLELGDKVRAWSELYHNLKATRRNLLLFQGQQISFHSPAQASGRSSYSDPGTQAPSTLSEFSDATGHPRHDIEGMSRRRLLLQAELDQQESALLRLAASIEKLGRALVPTGSSPKSRRKAINRSPHGKEDDDVVLEIPPLLQEYYIAARQLKFQADDLEHLDRAHVAERAERDLLSSQGQTLGLADDGFEGQYMDKREPLESILDATIAMANRLKAECLAQGLDLHAGLRPTRPLELGGSGYLQPRIMEYTPPASLLEPLVALAAANQGFSTELAVSPERPATILGLNALSNPETRSQLIRPRATRDINHWIQELDLEPSPVHLDNTSSLANPELTQSDSKSEPVYNSKEYVPPASFDPAQFGRSQRVTSSTGNFEGELAAADPEQDLDDSQDEISDLGNMTADEIAGMITRLGRNHCNCAQNSFHQVPSPLKPDHLVPTAAIMEDASYAKTDEEPPASPVAVARSITPSIKSASGELEVFVVGNIHGDGQTNLSIQSNNPEQHWWF